MKTASPNSGSDVHTLTPTAMSAARTQTDLHEQFEGGQPRGAVRLSRLECADACVLVSGEYRRHFPRGPIR